MGKVSTKLNISHKSLLVVSLRLATGELYLLDLKIYINVSFILSGLNRPVLTNKALSSVISFPFLPFKYNTFPPSPICINLSGYSTPNGIPQYLMLYGAWQFKPNHTLWAQYPPSKPFSGRKRGNTSTLSLTPCGSICTSAYGSNKYGKYGSSPSPPTHPGLP